MHIVPTEQMETQPIGRRHKMKTSFRSALLGGALLLILSPPCLAARAYESYYDVLGSAAWFDGVRSTIDYRDTTVGTIGSAAWCGIDNFGTIETMRWIQGGWVKWRNAAARVYWEYKDKDGTYARGYDQAPSASEAYEQIRNGDNVEWKHGPTVYKTEPWTKFSTIEFRKVQYGAEMLDSPSDHTPGKSASKNNFAASMARRAGAAFAFTGLATSVSSAESGNLEKYGAPDSGNFRTWDTRDN
jgi:hypothetical protein